MNNLHSALKTSIIQEVSEGGIHYKYVRLQHSKDHFINTLHARPSEWSTAGLQTTDLLRFLGFQRFPCAFHGGECYARELSQSQDIIGLAQAMGRAFSDLKEGARHLEHCGIYVDQPEGWGYFLGKPSSGRRMYAPQALGDGHVAPKSERMKESEDNIFHFVFTWIDGAGDKGWTTHYRAKHMPLSPEFAAVLNFLDSFSSFPSCPEFGFESCWWRFTSYEADSNIPWGRNTEQAHNGFDAHAMHFSSGVEKILTAHSALQQYGLAFLVISDPISTLEAPPSMPSRKTTSSRRKQKSGYQFDVAISFAGTERQYAEELANRVREAGFEVFYDDFYPEQLWGKDLPAFFDRVYRKESRFCVIFVSAQYAERIWTSHERRSAQARALEEKGREYILPIRVDSTDLDGLPPTVKDLSMTQYSMDQIASLLIKKLQEAT